MDVVQVAESEDEIRTFVFYGKLVASEAAVLRFSLAGPVEAVAVSEGDTKKQGDVLAVVAQPKLTAEKAQLDVKLQQLKDSVVGRSPTQRSQIQQQIADVQAQQQQLDAQLSNGILTAPFDCIVRRVGVTVGKPVSPVVAAFEVVADRQPIVVGRLPASTVLPLPDDQSVWVAIAGKSFKCRLRQSAEETGQAVAEFVESLPAEYWLFGDVVEARFRLQLKSDGYWLPMGALRRGADGGWTVLAAEADVGGVVLENRTVNVLRTTFDSMLVDGQISIDDLIVAAGSHRVVAGQRVVVSAAGAEL